MNTGIAQTGDQGIQLPGYAPIRQMLALVGVFAALCAGAWVIIHPNAGPPGAASALQSVPADTLSLHVDVEGRTYIGQQLLNRNELVKALRQFKIGKRSLGVRVDAPHDLKAAALLEIMRTLKTAGIERTAVEVAAP